MAATAEATRYERSSAVTATLIDDEVLCLNLDTGQYTGLKNVAQTVWGELEVPCTLDDLLRVVLSEYDVAEQVARTDLQRLLSEMLQTGLVQRT